MQDPDLARRRFLGLAGLSLAATAIASPEAFATPTPGARAAGTVRLGDLSIARLGYGAMRITGAGIWGEPADARTCRAVLRRALDLGVNFIDTANAYGPQVSERLIAEALHPYPRDLVIATKGGYTRSGPDRWSPDCRPESLRAACEGSLKRLKLERIDLYQLHAPDPKVPYEDSIGELATLQREGKIRHIGISNVRPEHLEQARSLVKVVSVQNRYNVFDRGADPIVAACERHGMAFIPWAPLGSAGRDSPPETGARAALEAVARQHGISLQKAQIVWLLSRSRALVPIPGTSKVEHLEDNVSAAALRFTRAEMQRIG